MILDSSQVASSLYSRRNPARLSASRFGHASSCVPLVAVGAVADGNSVPLSGEDVTPDVATEHSVDAGLSVAGDPLRERPQAASYRSCPLTRSTGQITFLLRAQSPRGDRSHHPLVRPAQR